jgi:hypothetical protein
LVTVPTDRHDKSLYAGDLVLQTAGSLKTVRRAQPMSYTEQHQVRFNAAADSMEQNLSQEANQEISHLLRTIIFTTVFTRARH